MTTINSLQSCKPPVVIGGVGGSGTRLIAQCLQKLGYFLGDDLNHASDNLWFALLFTRPEILDTTDEEFSELTRIFFNGMTGSEEFTEQQKVIIKDLASAERLQHTTDWLQARAETLLTKKAAKPIDTLWGWKAPNSHIVLDRLTGIFQGMKYIHVVRNGLDMAFSDNQNQLKIWGKLYIGDDCEITPHYSLKYWCHTHRRVQQIGKTMGSNFLFLNYEKFCASPDQGLKQLTEFLGLHDESLPGESLKQLIKAPDTIGRYKSHGTSMFAEEDIAYVKAIGFDTEG